jgi:hypothetical protein
MKPSWQLTSDNEGLACTCGFTPNVSLLSCAREVLAGSATATPHLDNPQFTNQMSLQNIVHITDIPSCQGGLTGACAALTCAVQYGVQTQKSTESRVFKSFACNLCGATVQSLQPQRCFSQALLFAYEQGHGAAGRSGGLLRC